MEFKSCGKPIDSLLERVLSVNIQNSDYFKELYRVKTYEEAVDEIYEHVGNVEPWMTGNLRGPSTAFCLLYKLFTLNLDGKQVQGLLDHEDSPYIRALGFLFLRYNADPKTLWQWYEPYLHDEEEFSPGVSKKPTTMGVFIRDLLLGQYYYDSLLPRIPVPVIRQVASNLENLNLPKEASGVVASASRLGADGDGARRPPSVKAALSVAFGQRAPHRAATRESSPVRRGLTGKEDARNVADQSRSSNRVREGDRPRSRDGRDRDYDRSRPLSRDGDRDRERDSDRDRERRRDEDGERDRDKDRDRERGRVSDRDRSRDYDRDRNRDRHRDRDGDRSHGRDRDRDRDGDYRSGGRGRDYGRSDRREGSRERSSERGRESRGREFDRDRRASQERRPSRSPVPTANMQKLKEMYGDDSGKEKKADTGSRAVRDSGDDDVIRLGSSTWR